MDYKNTIALCYSNADKETKVSTSSMDKDHHWSRTKFTDQSCLTIPLIDGLKIEVLKSNEFLQNKEKMMVWGSISIKGLIPHARTEFDRRW